jgi:ElaB/YqjD/DUF883 family membrane-anchored ribosome-binding protein
MVQTSDDFQTDLESAPTEEPKPEEIREQMAETRAALTEKLESLQERVEGTVETAQETVQDTLQAVKRTFDLRYQVNQRPWTMVGVSVLAGYTMGCLGRVYGGRRAGGPVPINGTLADGRSSTFTAHEVLPVRAPDPLPPVEKSSVLSQFDEELGKLKSVAIGAAMGLVRDWMKEAAPTVSRQLDEVMDSATRKLGGEPVAGPLLGHVRQSDPTMEHCPNA